MPKNPDQRTIYITVHYSTAMQVYINNDLFCVLLPSCCFCVSSNALVILISKPDLDHPALHAYLTFHIVWDHHLLHSGLDTYISCRCFAGLEAEVIWFTGHRNTCTLEIINIFSAFGSCCITILYRRIWTMLGPFVCTPGRRHPGSLQRCSSAERQPRAHGLWWCRLDHGVLAVGSGYARRSPGLSRHQDEKSLVSLGGLRSALVIWRATVPDDKSSLRRSEQTLVWARRKNFTAAIS